MVSVAHNLRNTFVEEQKNIDSYIAAAPLHRQVGGSLLQRKDKFETA